MDLNTCPVNANIRFVSHFEAEVSLQNPLAEAKVRIVPSLTVPEVRDRGFCSSFVGEGIIQKALACCWNRL